MLRSGHDNNTERKADWNKVPTAVHVRIAHFLSEEDLLQMRQVSSASCNVAEEKARIKRVAEHQKSVRSGRENR